jgi:competence protein ComEC
VYAWLPRYPIVAAGDDITFEGTIEPAPPEPGFGDVLRSLGADGSARPSSFEIVPSTQGVGSVISGLRTAADARLFAALPQRAAGLAAGILIGSRELVDRSVAAAFTTAGLSHIVAISGWNIGVVGAAMVALLGWLPRRPRSLIVLLAIVAYTLVTGASASVVRAAAMGAAVVVARESGRRGTAATALAVAVLALLVADPQMVSDVGFQLSTAATCGLLAWATLLSRALEARLPPRVPRALIETLAVSLAAQAATLPLILLEFGRLSLVAPLANLLAAPLIVPVMVAAVVALGVGTLAAWIPPLLLAPGLVAAWLPIAALMAVADVCTSLPLASITLPSPLDLLGAGVSAAAIGWVALRRTKRRKQSSSPQGSPSARVPQVEHARGTAARGTAARGTAARGTPARGTPARGTPARGTPTRGTAARGTHARGVPGQASAATSYGSVRIGRIGKPAAFIAVALILGTAAVVAARPTGRFGVTVLDIGQGDAILLDGDRGARVLIDGGPDPNLLLTRLDERIPTWDRRLDLLILSHPHEDHAAGLPLLMERFDVRAVADTGMLGNGPGDHAFRRELTARGIQPMHLATGDHLSIDDASASVLWPPPGGVPLHPANDGAAVNDVSVVLDIRFGARRFLLTGDVQQEIDPQLLAGGINGRQPPVDVLKVAHHGSATATTQAFLDAVRPRVAFVSAGLGNPYGHPAPSTIDRLRGAGADVFRTDLDGTLGATSDGTDLQVSKSGPHAVATPRPTRAGAIGLPALSTLPVPSTATLPAFSCAVTLPAIRFAVSASWRFGQSTSTAAVPGIAARIGFLHIRQDLTVERPLREDRLPELPCYDRPDEHSLARTGRRRPPRPPSRRRAPAPHDRRGRDRHGRLVATRQARCADRPPNRRDRGAAA